MLLLRLVIFIFSFRNLLRKIQLQIASSKNALINYERRKWKLVLLITWKQIDPTDERNWVFTLMSSGRNRMQRNRLSYRCA